MEKLKEIFKKIPIKLEHWFKMFSKLKQNGAKTQFTAKFVVSNRKISPKNKPGLSHFIISEIILTFVSGNIKKHFHDFTSFLHFSFVSKFWKVFGPTVFLLTVIWNFTLGNLVNVIHWKLYSLKIIFIENDMHWKKLH